MGIKDATEIEGFGGHVDGGSAFVGDGGTEVISDSGTLVIEGVGGFGDGGTTF